MVVLRFDMPIECMKPRVRHRHMPDKHHQSRFRFNLTKLLDDRLFGAVNALGIGTPATIVMAWCLSPFNQPTVLSQNLTEQIQILLEGFIERLINQKENRPGVMLGPQTMGYRNFLHRPTLASVLHLILIGLPAIESIPAIKVSKTFPLSFQQVPFGFATETTANGKRTTL